MISPQTPANPLHVAPARAALRAGLKPPLLPSPHDSQKTVLLSIPLFHVTGCLSWLMRAFFSGSKIVMMRKWDVKEAIKLIESEGVTVIGGSAFHSLGVGSS